MSLAMYASPITNDYDNQSNAVAAKKALRNKQQQQQQQQQQANSSNNTERVNTVLKSINQRGNGLDPTGYNENDNALGDFKPIPPPISVGAQRTGSYDTYERTTRGEKLEPSAQNDEDMDNLSISNHFNTQQVEAYIKSLIPGLNYKGSGSGSSAQESTNNVKFADTDRRNSVVNTYESDSSPQTIVEKLDYLINLLEEQQAEKTNNITEEIILYAFLGIFIIFLVDSFSRVGRYVR